MTSGEGGCIVTNDERLYNRAVACHDTGYARDSSGRAILDNLELCLWGHGYRIDELRASILRVQLKRLPTVIAHMHHSKYRIRKALEKYTELRLRRIPSKKSSYPLGSHFLWAGPYSAHSSYSALRSRAEALHLYEKCSRPPVQHVCKKRS
jgi:dTDP-4-amino-4,6-dideoxygalactose transaminase